MWIYINWKNFYIQIWGKNFLTDLSKETLKILAIVKFFSKINLLFELDSSE
jgi:hypothetical protein